MTVKELITELQNLGDKSLDVECLLAIDHSPGFIDADHIDVYPIESVYKRPIYGELYHYEGIYAKGDKPLEGYWFNQDEKEKVLLYVFP